MKNHNCHICGSEWCWGKCWDKSIETVRVDCLFDGRLTYYRSPDRILEFVDEPQEEEEESHERFAWCFLIIELLIVWLIVGVIL